MPAAPHDPHPGLLRCSTAKCHGLFFCILMGVFCPVGWARSSHVAHSAELTLMRSEKTDDELDTMRTGLELLRPAVDPALPSKQVVHAAGAAAASAKAVSHTSTGSLASSNGSLAVPGGLSTPITMSSGSHLNAPESTPFVAADALVSSWAEELSNASKSSEEGHAGGSTRAGSSSPDSETQTQGSGAAEHPIPSLNADPVLVRVGVRLRKLYGIDLGTGEWTGDVVLTLVWSDTYAGQHAVPEGSDSAQMTVQAAKGLFWIPDVGILYKATKEELLSSTVNVTAIGQVTITQRVLVSVVQTFQRAQYPFDTQTLTLKVGSRSMSAGTLALEPVQNETAQRATGVSDDVMGASSADEETEWLYEANTFEMKVVTVNDGLSRRSTLEAHAAMKRNSRAVFAQLIVPEVLSVVVAMGSLMLPPIDSMSLVRFALSISAFVAAFSCLVLHVDPQLGYDTLSWFHNYKETCALLAFSPMFFNASIEVIAQSFKLEAFTAETAFVARCCQLAMLALTQTFLMAVPLSENPAREGLINRIVIFVGLLVFCFWVFYTARWLRRKSEAMDSDDDEDTNETTAQDVLSKHAFMTAAAASSRTANVDAPGTANPSLLKPPGDEKQQAGSTSSTIPLKSYRRVGGTSPGGTAHGAPPTDSSGSERSRNLAIPRSITSTRSNAGAPVPTDERLGSAVTTTESI